MSELAGQRVLVVGLGDSGVAAAKALVELGAKVRVTESGSSAAVIERARELENLGVDVEIGGHDLEQLDADIAILSPGVPPTAPVVEALRRAAVPVISEVELAARLARCDLLAVTGTNGKTTTTSLLADMLAAGDVPSVAAGNIGRPLIDAVGEVPSSGAIAVEVSSFQLATIETFHPKVAVVLNIAEDHTDWHGSIDEYATAKGRITLNQRAGDHLILNVTDERVRALAERTAARVTMFSSDASFEATAHYDGASLIWENDVLVPAADLHLAGQGGIEDALAAAAAALRYGVSKEAVVDALRAFRPLHHRVEVVGSKEGVTFIDDSKATNPHATLAALADLRDVVLIAGGRSKGIDLSVLRTAVPPVTALVALGEATDELGRIFAGVIPVERASDMSDAVRRALRHAVSGGSVLLSPACASLDMYAGYAERGEHFQRAVRAVIEEGEG